MSVQAPLGEQGASEDGEGDHAEGQEQEPMLEAIGQAAGDQDNDDERHGSSRLTPERRRVLSVQPAIERADKRSHPRHRMADCASEPVGIAEHGLEQQCKERK